ncbi:hypothetical protein HKX48_004949 [Thoreauomyces humboldtii]|nr:hypothetical protein HKX48_004949 [Thoreauomyces humboldtii]
METQDDDRRDKGITELGTYMLRGWVMTDITCGNPGCNLPTVRSKDRVTQMCVLCDDPRKPYPPVNLAAPAPVVIVSDSVVAPTLGQKAKEAAEEDGEDEDEDDDDELEALMLEDLPPTAHSLLTAERRAQGDIASKRIGQKMLQGWTLLDENCPTETCFGIPLMKSREKRKVCVMCDGKPPAAPPVVAPTPAKPEAVLTSVKRDGPTTGFSASDSTSAHEDTLTKRRKTVSTSSVTEFSDQVDLTIATLMAQMEELRQSIEARRNNAGDFGATCDAIASCASAVVALQAIRK